MWSSAQSPKRCCTDLLLGDLFGNRELEIPSQIGDRRVLDRFATRAVGRSTWIELVGDQKLRDLCLVTEIEPVPVDDRAPPQHQPDRLEIGEAQLIEGAEIVVFEGRVHGSETSSSPSRGIPHRAKPREAQPQVLAAGAG